MLKNDFSNMNVGNFYNIDVDGSNEVIIRSNTYFHTKHSSDEDMISDILKVSEETEFKNSIQRAEETFANKSENEIRKIVEETVKQYINSAEKKISFLKKVKQFTYDISKSFVAGLLLQCIKELVFKA